MADAASAPKEGGAEKPKGGLPKAVLIGIIAACFIGGIAAGPQIGARLHLPGYNAAASAAKPKAHKPEAEEEEDDDEEEEAASGGGHGESMTAKIDSVVVDLRSDAGEMHHLKVGLALELKNLKKADEFKPYEPRARDAAITYLRTIKFEDAASTAQFEPIRKELSDRVRKAAGTRRVKKVLLTDFVLQ